MLKLYGSNVSYFTGKMENYLQVREIPYALHTLNRRLSRSGTASDLLLLSMYSLKRKLDIASRVNHWLNKNHDPNQGKTP